jgi:hypothetical protein
LQVQSAVAFVADLLNFLLPYHLKHALLHALFLCGEHHDAQMMPLPLHTAMDGCKEEEKVVGRTLILGRAAVSLVVAAQVEVWSTILHSSSSLAGHVFLRTS